MKYVHIYGKNSVGISSIGFSLKQTEPFDCSRLEFVTTGYISDKITRDVQKKELSEVDFKVHMAISVEEGAQSTREQGQRGQDHCGD